MSNYVEEISPSKFISAFSESERSYDLSAVISSISRFKHSNEKQIRRLVKATGSLTPDEIEKFERVYSSGISDLIELMNKDPKMKELF